jgi:hypothetical protein
MKQLVALQSFGTGDPFAEMSPGDASPSRADPVHPVGAIAVKCC